mgnify:CR=1 FL=1
MIAKAHLSWFNLKCPYLVDSKEYNTGPRKTKPTHVWNLQTKAGCQRRTKTAPNAGEKVHHLAGSGRSKTAPACWV